MTRRAGGIGRRRVDVGAGRPNCHAVVGGYLNMVSAAVRLALFNRQCRDGSRTDRAGGISTAADLHAYWMITGPITDPVHFSASGSGSTIDEAAEKVVADLLVVGADV